MIPATSMLNTPYMIFSFINILFTFFLDIPTALNVHISLNLTIIFDLTIKIIFIDDINKTPNTQIIANLYEDLL